jgi:hypothetical protein
MAVLVITACKGKVVFVYSMKAYRGRRGMVALILYLGTEWK